MNFLIDSLVQTKRQEAGVETKEGEGSEFIIQLRVV
jgi:hypothetical protein